MGMRGRGVASRAGRRGEVGLRMLRSRSMRVGMRIMSLVPGSHPASLLTRIEPHVCSSPIRTRTFPPTSPNLALCRPGVVVLFWEPRQSSVEP